jgi:hypothetical protein
MSRRKRIQIWNTRNIVSAVFMLLVLSFLTVSNSFLYSTKMALKSKIAQDSGSTQTTKKADRPLPNTEEEKSHQSSISNSMNEEFLHESHFVVNTNIETSQSHYGHFYLFYIGKNYAQLHAQPPDLA